MSSHTMPGGQQLTSPASPDHLRRPLHPSPGARGAPSAHSSHPGVNSSEQGSTHLAWLERTPRYRAWQSLLEAEFLSSGDGPTVLLIDDDELRRLCPHTSTPDLDLAEAVRELVDPALGHKMFDRISAVQRRWTSSPQTDAPPVLPLLGLTVLAATRMRRDGVVRANNYYLRLAEALLPRAGQAEIESAQIALRDRSAFTAVAAMWRALDSWIDDQDGAAGFSTIRDHSRLSRIGYPLSQAIVSRADRTVLTRFFAALEVKSQGVPQEADLFRFLELWAARPREFSEAFRHALADDNLRPVLSGLVHRLAGSWDGQVRTADGRRSLGLHLTLDLEEWHTRWLIAADQGPDALTLTAPGGTAITLTREPESPFYAGASPITVEGAAAQDGLRLTGDDHTAEFAARRVIFFRRHAYTGTWVSCESLTLFEDLAIAVAAEMAPGVRSALEEAIGKQLRLIRQRPPHVLLEGFALFEGVRFDAPQHLETALREFPVLGHLRLIPEGTARPRLVRGLPLATHVSRSCYLKGGEPDLVIPAGPEPRTVTITLDGTSQTLRATGFPIELRRFADLETGHHVITVDGDRLELSILDAVPGAGPQPGSGTYAWTADGTLTDHSPTSFVAGALVHPPDMTVPPLARRGRKDTVLLYDDGRAELLLEPAFPHFLSEDPLGTQPIHFEIHPPTGARWLAQRRHNPRQEQWDLTSLDPAHPATYTLKHDVPALWKRVCTHEAGPTLWRWHLDNAGGPHDR